MNYIIKKVFIFMSLMTYGLIAYSENISTKIIFQTNKIHCLFNFVDAISGSNYGSTALKDYFEKSKFNTPETQQLLQIYAQLDLYNGINYTEFPSSRRMGRNIFEILIIQSAYSKNLDDFSQRTLGLLPHYQHIQLFEILNSFEPIYEELIWQKFSNDTYRAVKQFKILAKKSNLNNIFLKTKKFYKSSWPDQIPFIISIYPIPTDGNLKATPMANVETVGIYVKEKNINLAYAAMFHEICHSLYESQSVKTQYEIENYFSNKDQFAFYAYQYLNEALATCIGNGETFYKITGKLDSAAWHNNLYYDNYARAIYPLIKEYLETNKSIDTVFFEKTVVLFQTNFPNIIYEYKNLFSSISIFCDGGIFTGKNVKKAIRKYFTLNQVDSYSPINTEIDPKAISNTIIIFVHNKQNDQLKELIKKSPILLNYQDNLINKNNYVFNTLDARKRAYFIFKANNVEIIFNLLNKLKEQKFVDTNIKFIFQ